MQLSLAFIVASSLFALSTAYPYEQQQAYSEPNHEEWPQEHLRARRSGGGWSVDVNRDQEGGTRVRGDVSKRFESDNGKIRGEIRGHIDRTYGGPNDGTRSRGIGLSIGGDWR